MSNTRGGAVPTRYDWEHDRVTTAEGVVVPVRATARRPTWLDLPRRVRDLVESRLGAAVVASWSAGTGFTPGLASRLSLSDGTDVFVKAASSADDELHGWPLSDAYRNEIRKLHALPEGIGAPPLRWHEDAEIDGEQWVVAAYEFVAGAPPRRPWRPGQLALVTGRLGELATRLTPPPTGLALDSLESELMGDVDYRLHTIREHLQPSRRLDQVVELCRTAAPHLHGETVVHMDLRDDNVLIDDSGEVWIVDWNWPVVGAAWTDLVCVLLSARGDGLDVEQILREHALTSQVPPESIDALLALLWSFWAVGIRQPVPAGSPHLRDHQLWYEQVTRGWLTERLSGR
jgi:hypothetical protein